MNVASIGLLLLSSLLGFAQIRNGHVETVDQLIAELKGSDNPYVRRNAAVALSDSHTTLAIEPLVNALLTDSGRRFGIDRDREVEQAAANALTRFKDPRAIKGLVVALNENHDAVVRVSAAKALADTEDESAVEPLIHALHNDSGRAGDAAFDARDPTVQAAAAAALAAFHDKRSLEALIAALRDANVEVRRNAAAALEGFDEARPVEPLITALQDSDSVVRAQAAESLAWNHDPRAASALIDFMKRADPDVRQHISERLVAIGTPAVQPLISALSRPESEVQSFASRTLGTMGKPEVLGSLIEALASSDSTVRKNAAVALGDIQDPEAVAPLIAALNDPDPDVRRAAAVSLSQSGDSQAIGPLIARLKDPDPEVRGTISSALSQFQASEVVDALIPVLNDPNATVRREAAGALGRIEDPAAIASLIQALRDSDARVQETAGFALGAMGTPAIDPLIAMMKADDLHVEELAAEALMRMKTGVVAVNSDTLRLLASLESDFLFFTSFDNPLTRLSEIIYPNVEVGVAAGSPPIPILSQLPIGQSGKSIDSITHFDANAFGTLFNEPSPLRLFIAPRGTPGLNAIERTGGGLRVRFVESRRLR